MNSFDDWVAPAKLVDLLLRERKERGGWPGWSAIESYARAAFEAGQTNVSREGEVGSRSATEPDANLAGPEGDARPKCIHCYGDLMPNCIYCGGVGHKPEDCATPCDYYPTEHDPITCRCPVGCNAPKGVGP